MSIVLVCLSWMVLGVGDNAKGCGDIGLYGSGWLRMAHFYEEVSLGNGSRVFMSSAPSSAFDAEDIIALMIWTMVRTAPIVAG